MCDYLSFLTDMEGDTFWFEPMLMSHSGAAKKHGLKPETYRECEWTADDEGESLIVRTHPDDKHDAAYLRACVLAKWPTRNALEDWLIANMPESRIRERMAIGGDYSTLTGGHGSTLTGGAHSTLTGGHGSTLTGGHGSTLTGGAHSTLTGGAHSTLTGGHGSTLTGGDYSTLTGGARSTLTGGHGSTLTGGHGSTLTGGEQSVLLFWHFNDRWSRHVAVVGRDGIKPGVAYRVVGDKIVEAEQATA